MQLTVGDIVEGKIIAKEDFASFNNEKVFDSCLDVEDKQKIKVTDEQAKKIIEKISKCKNVAEFQALNIKLRDRYLNLFKEKGLSIRQISRLTGTSYYIVQKA